MALQSHKDKDNQQLSHKISSYMHDLVTYSSLLSFGFPDRDEDVSDSCLAVTKDLDMSNVRPPEPPLPPPTKLSPNQPIW